MTWTAGLLTGALMALCGCGTIVPGPRYQVNVDDYAFSSDGTGVFYLEDRFRLYPFLLGAREDRFLYLYDEARRRHRTIAKTGAFSVSPSAPLVLYAPEWEKRFRARGAAPGFYLLDHAKGETRGFSMPAGFKNDYLTYSFPYVDWGREGNATAYVYFYYMPGARPASWRWLGPARHDWRRELWKVRIDPAKEGGEVALAEPCAADGLPRVAWKDIRKRKGVSADGTRELAYTRYVGHFSFNTTLAVTRKGGGEPEYVVKENALINYAQAGYYSLMYILSAPVFGANSVRAHL
jgi:hypothetical protein